MKNICINECDYRNDYCSCQKLALIQSCLLMDTSESKKGHHDE